MSRLWAPWRIKYVKARKTRGCIFCASLKSKGKRYIILKSLYSLAMLNLFPYNNGHLMIAPLRHIGDIAQLKEPEVLDLFKTLKTAKMMLDRVLRPEGYNIGLNLSRIAGAGLPGHLHIHLVPRFKGDTNFMPVIANTKVISQSLEELYKRLKHV